MHKAERPIPAELEGDQRLSSLLREVTGHLPESARADWASQVAPLAVGITDASDVLDRLAVRRLRETVLPLAPSWPAEVRGWVVSVIEQVIAAIEAGDLEARAAAELEADSAADRSARAAARSAAWSAARSETEAARAAAWSVRESAWSAARSEMETAARSETETAAWSMRAAAWSAAWSVRPAAWSAAWSAEADRILDELRRERDA